MKLEVDKERGELTFETSLLEDGILWFTEENTNELYRYKIENREVEFVCKIFEEEEYGYRLFGDMVCDDNNIYLIPCSATKLYIIDKKTFTVEGIEIPKPKSIYSDYMPKVKFFSAHVYNNHIYMVGATYPAILDYDCILKKIYYHDEWLPEMMNYFITDDKAIFRKTVIKDGIIYAPSCRSNVVLQYNVETNLYKLSLVGDKTCNYSAICYHNECFWLSPRGSGPIVKWNPEIDSFMCYSNFPQQCERGLLSFSDIVSWNNKIIIVPMLCNQMLDLDEETGGISVYDNRMQNVTRCSQSSGGNMLIIFSLDQNELFVFKNDNLDSYKLVMPYEQYLYHKVKKSRTYRVLNYIDEYQQTECLRENYKDALNDYILFIKKDDRNFRWKNFENTRIYEKIRDLQ